MDTLKNRPIRKSRPQGGLVEQCVLFSSKYVWMSEKKQKPQKSTEKERL